MCEWGAGDGEIMGVNKRLTEVVFCEDVSINST